MYIFTINTIISIHDINTIITNNYDNYNYNNDNIIFI